MTAFTYTITLRGTDNEKSSITYDLGDFTGADAGADFLAALGAANQIRGALVDITDANVAEEAVRHVISSDNQLPAAADVYEEALLTVHLADPAEAEKVALLRVPAPSIGVFVAATGADRAGRGGFGR